MIPIELKLSPERRSLAVTWEDGSTSHLGADLLRRHSRAASAVRARLDGAEPETANVTMTGIDPVGGYAVRLSFSDGHNQGIYPWPYLHAIATGMTQE